MPQRKSQGRQRSVPAHLDVRAIKGVGPAMSERLAKLNIHSVRDLLFHLPLRYEDRTTVTPIAALQSGQSAMIECEVRGCDVVFGRRRSLLCKVQDATGITCLRFFHFSAAQKNALSAGTRLRCFGEPRAGRSGLEIAHPEIVFLNQSSTDNAAKDSQSHDTLTAVYPSTEGIQQTRWRQFIKAAFSLLSESDIPELLDQNADDASLYATLQTLHFPPLTIDLDILSKGLHPLQRRIAFEELVAQRLSHTVLRQRYRDKKAIAMRGDQTLASRLQATLPFTLTSAQQRVVDEIFHDLCRPAPMMRLVQGDVGSGKTIVAALAAAIAIADGLQVALMAPTELLAEQHAAAFSAWLQPLGVNVTALASKMPASEKAAVLEAIADNSCQLVVGTHALIQKGVDFLALGLVIVDEQHRFGVEQRGALMSKAAWGDDASHTVHQLVMTATPIPRTLAMTFYADLDVSIIDELPPGRTPIETVALGSDRREHVVARVAAACCDGKQAYWVCTLVEESEALQAQAAESTASELAARLPTIAIGLVHGRLKSGQKQRVMSAFKRGDIDLLVATTVIEVGVDVPNASLMIIENPERLGLAQLHQLRGRVGRGSVKSHCVLLYQKPLSKNARQRIDIMRETNDGFVLAERDLHMRGPGEVLGKRQSGAVELRIADLQRDADLVADAAAVADRLSRENYAIVAALIQRWCPAAENYLRV